MHYAFFILAIKDCWMLPEGVQNQKYLKTFQNAFFDENIINIYLLKYMPIFEKTSFKTKLVNILVVD